MSPTPATPFPPLHWQKIQEACADKILGNPFFYTYEVDSTQTWAAQLPSEQTPPGSVFVADHQIAGSGRLGRAWTAPSSSSLLCTLVVEPTKPLWTLPMIAGLAILDTLAIYDIHATLKWPNDVLISGKKCAGILISTKRVGLSFLPLLGIGINVYTVDPALPFATCIQDHTTHSVSRERLFIALFSRLEHWLLSARTDPSGVRRQWKEFLSTLGNPITIQSPLGEIAGIAEDVTDEGALLIRDDGGKQHVYYAGDITALVQQEQGLAF